MTIMNKFKNNKWVSIISQLTPLFLTIWMSFYIEFDHPQDKMIMPYLMNGIPVIWYMAIIIINNMGVINIINFSFNSKIIYTKYGDFFITSDGNYFTIYDNIYWLWLTPIEYGRMRNFNKSFETDVECMIRNYVNDRLSNEDRSKRFKSWSGIIGIEIQREKDINELLK